MRILVGALLLAAIGGCSIKQNVTPATLEAGATTEICMIPAQGLRPGFHSTYRDLLIKKGFTVKELHSSANPALCPLSTAYVGNWAWDLALYMVYADIKVFQKGQQVGQATYDARWGGGRMDKFIDAESKITELTNQLFPAGAMAIAPATTSIKPLQPLSKAAYQEQQLQHLMQQNLPYEEYQRQHRAIMVQ